MLVTGSGMEIDGREPHPEKEGYTFLGWSETPDAQTPAYNVYDNITLRADTTLYAVWRAIPELQEEVDVSFAPAYGWDIQESHNQFFFTPGTSAPI